jgi:hypothetical protein
MTCSLKEEEESILLVAHGPGLSLAVAKAWIPVRNSSVKALETNRGRWRRVWSASLHSGTSRDSCAWQKHTQPSKQGKQRNRENSFLLLVFILYDCEWEERKNHSSLWIKIRIPLGLQICFLWYWGLNSWPCAC